MPRPNLLLAALAAALLAAPSPAAAAPADSAGVTAAVKHALAAFNSGDLKAWAAACDSPASVIDEFAPHEWQGPTACADWAKAFVVDEKTNAISKPRVVLGTPWHVSVTGDRAYVVAPATYEYNDHGKPARETGSFMTFALRKTAAGWLFTGWTWSAVTP
jgi:ketosteroid isomerase-like protein